MRPNSCCHAMLMLLALAPTGCAMLAPGTGYSGGSATLGDAVAAANADSTTKVRRMDTGEAHAPDIDVEVVETEPLTAAAAVSPPARDPRTSVPWRPLFGVTGGGGAFGGSKLDRLESYGLTAGAFETGRLRLVL